MHEDEGGLKQPILPGHITERETVRHRSDVTFEIVVSDGCPTIALWSELSIYCQMVLLSETDIW